MHAERRPFSNIERKVHASASRRAKKQLMQIPWNRFRQAYEAYPEWQALSLWSRAVLGSGHRALPEVLKTLRKRCPQFLKTGAATAEPELLGFRLLEWVHSTVFRYAKRDGWFDALTFYGVRHVRSEAFWAHWEQCENDWSKTPPRSVPTFEQWKGLALQATILGAVSYSEASRAVEKYIQWEAAAEWIQPLIASDAQFPKHVVFELETKFRTDCYELVTKARSPRSPDWGFLIRAAKQRCLRVGRTMDCQDKLLRWARSHASHVRLTAYGKLWVNDRLQKRAHRYPSLHQWKRSAERFYVTSIGMKGRV